MLLNSFVFPCLWGYVSAFGTKKNSSFRSCFCLGLLTLMDMEKIRQWMSPVQFR